MQTATVICFWLSQKNSFGIVKSCEIALERLRNCASRFIEIEIPVTISIQTTWCLKDSNKRCSNTLLKGNTSVASCKNLLKLKICIPPQLQPPKMLSSIGAVGGAAYKAAESASSPTSTTLTTTTTHIPSKLHNSVKMSTKLGCTVDVNDAALEDTLQMQHSEVGENGATASTEPSNEDSLPTDTETSVESSEESANATYGPDERARWRVKVYEMNHQSVWEDKGTGHCQVVFIEVGGWRKIFDGLRFAVE